MVTKWGLNEKMGPILYGEDDSQAPGGGNTHYSEDTSREIDQEVKIILNEAYERATELLQENRDILEAMKDALMEYETIDADQVDDLMSRRKVRPPKDWDSNDFDSPSGGGKSPVENPDSDDMPLGDPVEGM
jgi:cell division protease FtsH